MVEIKFCYFALLIMSKDMRPLSPKRSHVLVSTKDGVQKHNPSGFDSLNLHTFSLVDSTTPLPRVDNPKHTTETVMWFPTYYTK